jgi:hypothetical protein
MGRIGTHCCLALVLVVASAFQLSVAQEKPAQVMHRIQAGERSPDGWFLATSTRGEFGLKLPVKFNDFSVGPMTLTTGGFAEAHIVGGVDQETGAKFSMTCMRYIKGAPTLAPALKNGTPITHQGCKGYANSGAGAEKGRKTEGQSRAFLVPSGTCIAIMEYPVEAREKVAPQAPVFFKSIDLPGHGCQK